MTLSSRHRAQNSSPGGLRPSTLPLGHRGSPQYWLSHVDGEETFLFLSNRRDGEPNTWTLAWKAAVLTTTLSVVRRVRSFVSVGLVTNRGLVEQVPSCFTSFPSGRRSTNNLVESYISTQNATTQPAVWPLSLARRLLDWRPGSKWRASSDAARFESKARRATASRQRAETPEPARTVSRRFPQFQHSLIQNMPTTFNCSMPMTENELLNPKCMKCY